MKYIAYAYIGRGGKEWNSAPYDTREQAAKQAFACFPKLKSVATCRATNTSLGWWPTGSDIQAIRRDQVGY